MDFSELTNTNHKDFALAMNIYSNAFPFNERQPVSTIKERVEQGLNRIYVGRIDADIAFIALLWPLKNTDFILLDYMATSPAHRGRNIASQFLQSMRKVLEENKKYFILEVEDPEFGDNREDRQKRVAFYRRNGAKELKGVKYILPPVQGTAYTDMILMIFPNYQQGKMNARLVRNLISQIYNELYNRNAEDTLLKHLNLDTNIEIDLV